MANHKHPFDWDQVDKLLEIQCTGEEIAGVLGISYDTIARHCEDDKNCQFADYSRQKRQGGRASLRRRQWQLSETNAAMAIFLGKNLLGQKDKLEDEDGEELKNVTINYNIVKK